MQPLLTSKTYKYMHILSMFVALGIQHAMRMLNVVICDLSGLSYKRYDFRIKLVNIMCVLIFSITLSETFLILRGIERDMMKNVY
jgi:hypothetical protein